MRLGCVLSLFLSICLVAPALAQSVCAPIVLSSINIREETAGYVIGMEYPVLCQPEARHIIRDEMTKTLGEFKADFPEHDLTAYPRKHEMLSEYEVWKAGHGRYASVKIQVMVYTGGAHPIHWPMTWVFDMTDGRVLGLEDIFNDVGAALGRIAPMVRDVLKAKLGEMAFPDMLDPGTAPTEENYRFFIITEEGVAFFFSHYQVAPYVAGQQVVTIPWEQLDGVLTPTMLKRVVR